MLQTPLSLLDLKGVNSESFSERRHDPEPGFFFFFFLHASAALSAFCSPRRHPRSFPSPGQGASGSKLGFLALISPPASDR